MNVLTILDEQVVWSLAKGDYLTRFNKISSLDAAIYYIRDRIKYQFENFESYLAWSGDRSARVSVFSKIEDYNNGTNLSYLVKGSGAALYLIDRGAQKRPFQAALQPGSAKVFSKTIEREGIR